MDKTAALKLICESAKEYRLIANREYAFVYGEKSAQAFQCSFRENNFLHLTGAQLSSRITASEFFLRAYDERLSLTDFSLRTDGTTAQKLQVLSILVKMPEKARSIGPFDGLMRIKLQTDILVGNTIASMGFIYTEEHVYLPNTALKENISKCTVHPDKILLTLSRDNVSTNYSRIEYCREDLSSKYVRNLSKTINISNPIIDKLLGYIKERDEYER